MIQNPIGFTTETRRHGESVAFGSWTMTLEEIALCDTSHAVPEQGDVEIDEEAEG